MNVDPSRYEQFCKLYDDAEYYIKQLDRLDPEGGADIPAINELRYAGCHIKRSLRATDEEERSVQIDSAQRHCKRSICDSLSVIVDFVSRSLKDIKGGDYKLAPIAKYVENHSQNIKEIDDIIEFIDHYTLMRIEGSLKHMNPTIILTMITSDGHINQNCTLSLTD